MGYRRFGLPYSGPMDWWAHQAANHLVGNPHNAACLEIGMTSSVIRVEAVGLIAVCGAGYQLYINQKARPLWMSFLTRPGDQLTLEKCSGGNWVYLGISGGIQSDVWLGSRSVYPRGNLGRYLGDGDQLTVDRLPPQSRFLAGRNIPVSLRPAYTQTPQLRVIDGPDVDRFHPQSIASLFEQTYQVSTQSDRMGYRLHGQPILHEKGADIVSRGMAMGEIQVPGDGQPIVMMADHPTAGGYTSLGTVAKVDWPLLAQSQPGVAKIRFGKTSVAEAQYYLKDVIDEFQSSQHDFGQEDIWLNL